MAGRIVVKTLDALAALYSVGKGPHSFILAGHCLSCAAALKSDSASRRQRYILGFWIVFFGAFGGSVVAGILMQRPDLSPNPAFKDVRILPFTLAAWYLVQYTPFGDWLYGLFPVRIFCRYCSLVVAESPLMTLSMSKFLWATMPKSKS